MISILTSIAGVISSAVPVAFGIGALAFFWGLVKYIYTGGKEGGDVMKLGLIALFIMASIWGIVALLQSTLGVQNVQSVNPPSIGTILNNN